MVWIKYYSSLLYIYFIPLRYVPWTYQFLCSTPLWLSSKKVFFRKNMQQWKFSAYRREQGDKNGGMAVKKIDSDDNDNRKGCLFRISTKHIREWFSLFFFSFISFRFVSFLSPSFLFPFFHEMITTNFIITFPISESVENYYLLFQVIFVRSQTINKHRKRKNGGRRIKEVTGKHFLCSLLYQDHSALLRMEKFSLEFLLKHNSIWTKNKTTKHSTKL